MRKVLEDIDFARRTAHRASSKSIRCDHPNVALALKARSVSTRAPSENITRTIPRPGNRGRRTSGDVPACSRECLRTLMSEAKSIRWFPIRPRSPRSTGVCSRARASPPARSSGRASTTLRLTRRTISTPTFVQAVRQLLAHANSSSIPISTSTVRVSPTNPAMKRPHSSTSSRIATTA